MLERLEEEHIRSGITYEEDFDDSPLTFDLDDDPIITPGMNKKGKEEDEDNLDNFLID